jgi:flagellar hook-associated protein 2
MNDYTTASKATKGSTGDIIPAALSNDSTARGMISQIQSLMTGVPVGMPSSSPYKSIGDLGITANSDGTLSMDANAFTTALTNNPQAAKQVFDFTGTTTNGVVNFSQGSAATTAKNVAFVVNNYNGNTGAWSGTLAADGGAPINVSGTKDGTITATDSGAAMGALAGLQLTVTGTGSGNLSLTTGVAQSAQDVVSSLTSTSGAIWTTLQSISSANTLLSQRITQEQELLDTRQSQLEQQFADMEATVAQMKAASGGLAGA